eukprot:TRINITY_DN3102_c0_g2_i2.p1 TRINITY_DN3102_c0_g2~~TRINITY_DN3102_c0_g2_i2.p1  ORF type:complete len:310 (+),score=42.86 TRINITY_DN3102_c0_g2_i2:37-966(+)
MRKSEKADIPPNRFTCYVYDISYFSGKLEAYLRYKEIPYDRLEVHFWTMATKIVSKTGLMEVPVLHDSARDLWLRDTTSIIEYFEENPTYWKESLEHHSSIQPSCPASGFLERLLEDYADEWLWRPALFYRWNFELDSEHLSRRFFDSFLNPRHPDVPVLFRIIPEFLLRGLIKRRQYSEYILNEGVRDDKAKKYCEKLYLRTLHILQEHFSSGMPFIGGKSPSIADFGFYGPFFRHFSLDPTPSKIMINEAPAVFEWVSRLWNTKESRLNQNQFISFKDITKCTDETGTEKKSGVYPLVSETLITPKK